MDTFFTSDLHFCHDKEFLYGPRGFNSVEEMNEAIVERWNKTVSQGDLVYVLGDIMLNDNEKGLKLFNSLNGKKFIIIGNHDTDERLKLFRECEDVIGIEYATMVKFGKKPVFLSHYPTMTANFDDGKYFSQHTFNFYGHTHQQNNFYNNNPFIYHVGVDSHDATPIAVDQIFDESRMRFYDLGDVNE